MRFWLRGIIPSDHGIVIEQILCFKGTNNVIYVQFTIDGDVKSYIITLNNGGGSVHNARFEYMDPKLLFGRQRRYLERYIPLIVKFSEILMQTNEYLRLAKLLEEKTKNS